MFKKFLLASLVLAGVVLGAGTPREAHAITYVNERGEEFTAAGQRIFYVVYYRSPYNAGQFHSLVCTTRDKAAYYSDLVKVRGSSTVFVRRVAVGGAEHVAVNARPEPNFSGHTGTCSGEGLHGH